MQNLTRVENAHMQPPVKKIKGHGQPQTRRLPDISTREIRNTLQNAHQELSNSIANYRDAIEGMTGSRMMSGVALSADLGAKFSLECIDYLLRRI